MLVRSIGLRKRVRTMQPTLCWRSAHVHFCLFDSVRRTILSGVTRKYDLLSTKCNATVSLSLPTNTQPRVAASNRT